MKSNRRIEKDKECARVLLSKRSTASEKNLATNALYKRYHNYLVNYFTNRGASSGGCLEARDLAMMTFEKAFMKISLYDPSGGAFSTWLTTIAKNTLIDYKRGNHNISVINFSTIPNDDDGFPYDPPSNYDSPFQTLSLNERRRKAHKMVDRLKSADHRWVIRLRYFEQRSYEEIVEIMEKPIGTIKATLFRAKQELDKLSESHKELA